MSLISHKKAFLNKLGLLEAFKLSKGRFKSLSKDQNFFASIQNDIGIISIWDLEKRAKIQLIKTPSKYEIMDCFISPDNNFLVATDNDKLYLYEIQSGKLNLLINDDEIFDENNYYIRISPDSRFIACGGDYISLRDIKTGQVIWKQKSPDGTASDLKFSDDGDYIISVHGNVYIWDTKSGNLVREIGYLDESDFVEIVSSSISKDNSIISGVTDGGLCLWTFEGELIYDNLTLYEKKIDGNLDCFIMDHFVDISPNNKFIACNAFEEKLIHIMDLTNGQIINVLNHDFAVSHIIFLHNIQQLLSADFNGNIFIWNYISDQTKIKPQEIDDIERLKFYIHQGEGQQVEFKSSLRWDIKIQDVNKKLEYMIVKTISGFLNSKGGIILIGVNDRQEIVGLEGDYKSLKKPNRDGFQLHLSQIISKYIKEKFCSFWSTEFIQIDKKDVCIVIVNKSQEPCYTRSFDKRNEFFYVRIESSTRAMEISDAISYIKHNFKNH
ncbi:hypothetical protein ES705_16303 [subsurface metagenome]